MGAKLALLGSHIFTSLDPLVFGGLAMTLQNFDDFFKTSLDHGVLKSKWWGGKVGAKMALHLYSLDPGVFGGLAVSLQNFIFF